MIVRALSPRVAAPRDRLGGEDAAQRPALRSRLEQARSRRRARQGGERPIWQIVVLLYGAIAVLVCLVIALAFVAAEIVTGTMW
jgi:hypothetical protein